MESKRQLSGTQFFKATGDGKFVSIRKLAMIFFLLLTLGLMVKVSHCATYNAASCNSSDVQTAINSAANGDTVRIPAGNCSWVSGISTSKQITLIGAGSGTSGTVISCGASSATNLLTVTSGRSYNTQIANMRFLPGTCASGSNYIVTKGSGKPILLHDVYFNLLNFAMSRAIDWQALGGVIWNMTMESTDIYMSRQAYGSESGSLRVMSPRAWDTASTMGTLDTKGDQNLYIEDSRITYIGQFPDVDDNGRVVIRHSTLVGASGATHGTTSTHGGRHAEIYDCSLLFTHPPNGYERNESRHYWARAATFLATGNRIERPSGGFGAGYSFVLCVENASRAGQWGCCTSYPCPGPPSDTGPMPHSHQVGWGHNGYQHVSDPVYIWDNTGTGATTYALSFNDGDRDCKGINPSTGKYYTTTDFLQSGRDYFLNAGAKPGWARYTYPHPLRQSKSPPTTSPSSPPQNLQGQP